MAFKTLGQLELGVDELCRTPLPQGRNEFVEHDVVKVQAAGAKVVLHRMAQVGVLVRDNPVGRALVKFLGQQLQPVDQYVLRLAAQLAGELQAHQIRLHHIQGRGLNILQQTMAERNAVIHRAADLDGVKGRKRQHAIGTKTCGQHTNQQLQPGREL